MALVACRECGQEISDTATKCPHCGHNFGAGLGQIAGILFVAFLVVALVMKGCQ